jgi:formylglycine-generating enzyme required for sulfatase activity
VDSVSWFDCGEWLARLNHWLREQWAALEGTAAAPQLALPSESQWEGACRAGSSTPFQCGDTLDPSWANYDANYTYGRGRKGEYRQRPTATGALAVVNRWGLAEMHGQLFEWCGDRWHPDPVGPGWRQDGSAWEEPDAALEGLQDQEFRLLRGGSWVSGPNGCRAAYRNSSHPGDVDTPFGVRPCCLLPPSIPS